MTQAFVYKWIHLPTGKWYIGSRTAAGCHINDGYICSSKYVKPLIKECPNEWHRAILCIGHPKEMLDLEIRILKALDARKDPLSLNRSNGTGPGGCVGKPNPLISQKLKGRKQPKELVEKRTRALQGVNKGKIRSEEFKQNLRKPKNPESVKKMLETRRKKTLEKLNASKFSC